MCSSDDPQLTFPILGKEFGRQGNGDRTFCVPCGVAVDESVEDVFVSVQGFILTGSFVVGEGGDHR